MDSPSSLNSTQEEICWSLSTSHWAVSQIGRRARLRALIIQAGRVTPGTPPSGEPARLADGPGCKMWVARKSDGGLIAVMCCLVCQSSPRLMRPFSKIVKDSDGTNPLSRDLTPRCPFAGDKWGIY